jgi:hypothetical protein
LDDETSFPEAPGTRETNPLTDGESMKATQFEATPKFEHFKKVMREVLAVPKARLDELVRDAKENSPRKGDPNAPGQKQMQRSKRTK